MHLQLHSGATKWSLGPIVKLQVIFGPSSAILVIVWLGRFSLTFPNHQHLGNWNIIVLETAIEPATSGRALICFKCRVFEQVIFSGIVVWIRNLSMLKLVFIGTLKYVESWCLLGLYSSSKALWKPLVGLRPGPGLSGRPTRPPGVKGGEWRVATLSLGDAGWWFGATHLMSLGFESDLI